MPPAPGERFLREEPRDSPTSPARAQTAQRESSGIALKPAPRTRRRSRTDASFLQHRRSVVALLALAPASGYVARAPLSARPRRTARVAPSMALITGSPFGYFDPLQLSKGKTEAEMNQLREYELKHGRVAMAAVFGLIVEPYIHPLAKSCHLAHPTDPILSGVELNFAGKAQILGFCGGVEALNYFIKKGDKYKPGDLLGAGLLRRRRGGRVVGQSYQEKELNNGRLAMVAFAGFITQYGLYGNVDDMLFKPAVKPASELTCCNVRILRVGGNARGLRTTRGRRVRGRRRRAVPAAPSQRPLCARAPNAAKRRA